MRPVDSKYPVTLGYRQKMRSRPAYIHRGIDFGVPVGTPVRATKGGKVVHAGRGGMGPAFGIHVVLLVDSIYVIYAHLSSESVAAGQTVSTGQQLGKSGATGNVTGPHLHYGEFVAFSYLRDRTPKFVDYQPAPDKPKPKAKPAVEPKPWFNVSFLNTWSNSVEGGRNFDNRLPALIADSTVGNPAVVAFAEVRESQYGTLKDAMTGAGYLPAAYTSSNMLAVFHRPHVQILGHSFAKFKHQDGGNQEGVLRVKFRIDGSRAQVGIIHLDVDSSIGKKRANVKEAYTALRRYGIATLLPDWKSRTVLIGDWNHKTVAADVLKPLGFKQLFASGIDQAWVGAKRADRGGDANTTKSDHKRLLVRLGRS